jgi:DNA-binding transcriptional regulator YhcF (GntR family)
MAERICDEILAGKYHSDDRIPSVREQAVMFEVNTNTVVKTYDLLYILLIGHFGIVKQVNLFQVHFTEKNYLNG